jgi:two-component system, NarL family, nitrate/nitrite response regulator NarL
MFGLTPSTLHGEAEAVQARIASDLRDLLLRFSRELESGHYARNSVLAEIPLEGYTYSLVRREETRGRKLSEKQSRVARLAAEGLSNKQIGAKLRITGGTVAAHMAQIYIKLDVHNRASLARRLLAGLKEENPV